MFSVRLSNNWKTVISIVISIIALSLLTSLKYKCWLQESVWNVESTVFPQFWYGQSKHINIFWQSSVQDYQTIENQWFQLWFPLSLLTYLKFKCWLQDFIWNLEWTVSPQFWYGQSKFINIFRQYYQTIENSDCLNFKCKCWLQELIWNLEWTVFLQFGYDQPKSINILRQCLV